MWNGLKQESRPLSLILIQSIKFRLTVDCWDFISQRIRWDKRNINGRGSSSSEAKAIWRIWRAQNCSLVEIEIYLIWLNRACPLASLIPEPAKNFEKGETTCAFDEDLQFPIHSSIRRVDCAVVPSSSLTPSSRSHWCVIRDAFYTVRHTCHITSRWNWRFIMFTPITYLLLTAF